MHYRTAILLLAVAVCFSIPAVGAVKYTGGGPVLQAYVSGVNEFSPGQDVVIMVAIQNNGLSTFQFMDEETTVARDDVPTTAKLLTVSLGSGNAPIVIKSDPQMVGDLAGSSSTTVKINAKITSNATNGEYQLPLTLAYKNLTWATQEASDRIQFQYMDLKDTLPLTIRIRPGIKVNVLDAVPEDLTVGNQGYLNLTLQNTGFDDGKKATVKLVRSGSSPVIPVDDSVYIGDLPSNGTVTCHYKVAISGDAGAQTYPVNVVVTYENSQGDTITSTPETVGIPVGGKLQFAAVSATQTISPGETKVITVDYVNNGSVTAYDAQARLRAVTPFTSDDDTAYLGDMKPGERVTARYSITAANMADAKTYDLDTEIRYRDITGSSQSSDMFKVGVQVVPAKTSALQSLFVPAVIVIILLLIGAGYYVFVKRKKL